MLELLKNVSFTSVCGLTSDAVLIANIFHSVIVVIKIFIPIALIVFGMLDLGRAVMSNDEKIMKEAQGKLIKRFIYAVLVFLIVTLVQTVIGFISNSGASVIDDDVNVQACINCFVNGVNSAGTCK